MYYPAPPDEVRVANWLKRLNMVLLCLASGVYLCQPSKDGGELQARILETVCSCSLSGTWQARRRTVSGREEAVQRANEAQQEMLKAGASKQ